MKLTGQPVLHKTFGNGEIVVCDGLHVTVRFCCGKKTFVYPDAFETFLCLRDTAAQALVHIEAERAKAEQAEALREQAAARQTSLARASCPAVRRSRSARPNIAFKCNFCDGGASKERVGFYGVCSDRMIRYNIETEGRTWCASEDSACARYLRREISRKELEKGCEDGAFVCYESQMLRDWRAMAGIVQNGERKGQPMHLSNVGTNSLCILTTREPGTSEEERFIFAVFLVDEAEEGNEREEGFVTTSSEFRLALSPSQARQMPFWKYHANENQPQVAAWNSGLHRYLTDMQAAQILRDVAAMKAKRPDGELAQRFLQVFCGRTGLDATSLEPLRGVLNQ